MWKVNTDIVARFLIAALLMYAPFTSMTQPDSVAAQTLQIHPNQGALIVLTMAVLSIIVLLDIAFNSIAECKIKICWAKEHRDFLYLLGAFLAISVPFSVVRYAILRPGAVYIYVLLILVCLVCSTIDARAKRPRKCAQLERRKFVREAE